MSRVDMILTRQRSPNLIYLHGAGGEGVTDQVADSFDGSLANQGGLKEDFWSLKSLPIIFKFHGPEWKKDEDGGGECIGGEEEGRER